MCPDCFGLLLQTEIWAQPALFVPDLFSASLRMVSSSSAPPSMREIYLGRGIVDQVLHDYPVSGGAPSSVGFTTRSSASVQQTGPKTPPSLTFVSQLLPDALEASVQLVRGLWTDDYESAKGLADLGLMRHSISTESWPGRSRSMMRKLHSGYRLGGG